MKSQLYVKPLDINYINAGRTLVLDYLRIKHSHLFLATRDGINFNYNVVPDDFTYFGDEAVEQVEMNLLFEPGYNLATSAKPWQNTLRGFRE